MSDTPLKSSSPENSSENEALRIDATENSADLGTEEVEGKVSEIAQDNASENKGDASSPKTQQSSQGDTSAAAEPVDRAALRERLLKTAPRERLMRAEVVAVLRKKKEKLESDIRSYEKKRDYHLLSNAVAQLRAVLRQIEIVAHAGLEALKELWLKVVHNFS